MRSSSASPSGSAPKLPGSVAVSGQRSLAVSANGVLAYRTDKRSATRLVWVDRHGVETGEIKDDGETWHYAPALSPDGKMLATSNYEAGATSGAIWVYDLARNYESRLTSGEDGDDVLAVWSPDGREIAFSRAGVPGASGIFRIDPRQPGQIRPWIVGDTNLWPAGWLADGPTLVYQTLDVAGGGTLWARSFATEAPARRIGSELASEWGATLSRDGRWLAYHSDSTRRMEVYVRRLDDLSGKSVRVSMDGGMTPAWRGDGRELYYLDDAGRIMAVPFEPSDPPRVGTPEPLFRGALEEATERQFDVTADGQRFILNRTLISEGQPIQIVLGWRERLQTGPQR